MTVGTWTEEIGVERSGEIFDQTPNEREIRDSVRGYLDRCAPLPEPSRDGRPLPLDRGAVRAMAAASGVYGVLVPESLGGAGLGFVEATTILEQMGRSLYGGGFLSSAVLAVELLRALDAFDAEAELLREIAAGETIAAVAICDERGRPAPAAARVTASPDGGGWRLAGSESFVLDGSDCDLLLVAASTDSGTAVFAVEMAAAGVARSLQPTLDQTRPLGRIDLDGAPGRPVGGADAAGAALAALLPRARAALAAEQLGAAHACLDELVSYVRQRTQFGQPIGSFQAVQHACADVLLAIDGARSTQRYAAWTAASGAEALPLAAAMAKLNACDAAFLAAAKSLQLHGGIGYTWEHPVHLFLKRAKSSQLLFGTGDDVYEEIAEQAGLAGFGSLFLAGRESRGRRLGIVTTSGGLGIHLADQASTLGLEVPALPAADQQAIGAALPSYASAANPVDVTANIVNDPDSLRSSATGLMRSGGVDLALVYATNVGAEREEQAFQAIADAYEADGKPMIALTHDDASASAMIARGVPAVADAEIAIRALAALADSAARKSGEPRAARDPNDPAVLAARELLAGGGPLTPDAAFDLLARFGVECAPHGVAASAEEAARVAAGIGGPVALKLAVGEIAHKSDVGGVVLGLEGEEVAPAAERLLEIAAREGLPARLLVQAMAAPGLELFAGSYRAPGIGPVLVFGLGGTTVEIVEETRTVLAAAGDGELREALGELAGGRLLGHRRGLSDAAAEAFVEILGRLGELVLSVPELAELDLNPILAAGDSVTVVDAVALGAGDAAI